MRSIFCLTALIGVIAFFATSADAQLPPVQGAGPDRLLMYKGVVEELKISQEQIGKIRETMADKGAKLRDAYEGLKDVPEAEKIETMRKLNKELSDIAQKMIYETLTVEQSKRLKQIEQQQCVPATLADEEVQKSLNLAAPQVAKIKLIEDESSKEIAQFQSTQQKLKQSLVDTMEKVSILQKDANEKALRVLTDEQKAKWKELVGEPFELKLPSFPKKK